jgi:hypothetical protein
VGPSGADGNANVVTGTVSPTNAEWLWNSIYWVSTGIGTATGYFSRYVNIPVDAITPEILSSGVVIVTFIANNDSSNWSPLPLKFLTMSQQYFINITYEVSEGNIRLHYFYIPNAVGATLPDLSAAVLPTYTFKYTVIGGNTVEAMAAACVDVSDQDAVMDYIAGM